jgi:putative hydrolase of the HAD superfamily
VTTVQFAGSISHHSGIAAVLFDLDDTLLDRHQTVERYLTGHALRANLAADVATAYRTRFHALDENGHATRSELFARLSEEFPLIGTADGLLRDFIDHGFATCDWLEGAVDVLAWCRAADLRLGVITNGSSGMQRAKLRALGLDRSVDVILVSEEEGIAKPDAEIFRRAATRLAVQPEHCAFVGDNPTADIHGSRGAGMLDIWIEREFSWPAELAPASHSITTLAELPRILSSAVSHDNR